MGVREMHCNRWSRVAAFIFAILLTAVSARSAPSPASLLHSNVAPRRDVSGSIMDAHDGSYRFFTAAGGTGKWYYYAMGYGLCKEDGVSCQAARCGTTWNNTVGLWTSPDLATWTQEVENVLPYDQRPNCTYYRVNVVFNKRSRLYVLWINAQNCASACPPGSVACYLTWTSSSPTGPFEAQGPVHTRFTAEGGVGDFSLFLDDDEHQTGWVIHKRTGRAPPPNGHRMLIEKLSPDYLRSTNETLGVFGDPFVEAPVLFKRKGVYYALFGKCCCFCAGGSGVGVYTAATAAGPYTKHQNIGCPTEPQGTCGCSSTPDPDRSCAAMKSVTMAQQNFVIQIPPTHPGEETQFLWTGDMWQSACRIHGLNCVKGWDLQYWSPLSWNDTTHPPLPVRMHWVDNVTIPPQVPQLAP